MWLPARAASLVFSFCRFLNLIHRRAKSVGIPLFTKSRRNRIPDDVGRNRICENCLKAISNFDSYLVLFEKNRQQHSVVAILPAEMPFFKQSIREIVQVFIFERWKKRDDQLIGRLLLKSLEILFELRRVCGR